MWEFLWAVAARPRISIPHSRSVSRWMHSLEFLADRFRYARAYSAELSRRDRAEVALWELGFRAKPPR